MTNSVELVFCTSGWTWTKVNGVRLQIPQHFFLVVAAGSRFQFKCNHTRLNWAAVLKSDEIRVGTTPTEIEILCCQQWTKLNTITEISDEHVSGWDSEFLRLYQAYRQPTPLMQFRVKTGIINILRYIIDRQPDSLRRTPAEKLKELIDEGLLQTHTLEQLSRECGYSSDHMRILFQREFGLAPFEYYNRARMVRAMTLIDNSDLQVNEIAEKCGFNQIPYFSTVFKKHFSMTPSQAIKRLRYR